MYIFLRPDPNSTLTTPTRYFLKSDAVQLLRGEPSASEEEHIRIMLVQMEVERVKFIVRSYVRTRLFKVSFV